MARAKQRAQEMQNLSHEEVMTLFFNSLEAIRAEAIAKGVAIDEEIEGD